LRDKCCVRLSETGRGTGRRWRRWGWRGWWG